MAYEQPLFDISLEASTDLSASQYCGVVVNSSAQGALPAAGADIAGVLQDKPNAAGRAGRVRVHGITKMRVGASTVTAGDQVAVDVAGKAVTAASTKYIVGIALTTGVSGAIVSVLLRPGGAKA